MNYLKIHLPILQYREYIFALMFSETSTIACERQLAGRGINPFLSWRAPINGLFTSEMTSNGLKKIAKLQYMHQMCESTASQV